MRHLTVKIVESMIRVGKEIVGFAKIIRKDNVRRYPIVLMVNAAVIAH